jgi:hypothetical protein
MRSVQAGRVAVATWLAAAASGCTVWKVESASPRQVMSNPKVTEVRILSTDSLKLEVYDAKLVGDSIYGHPSKQAVARIHVPLSHVRTISTLHKSVGRTALMVLAAGGVVAVYALLQSLNAPGY